MAKASATSCTVDELLDIITKPSAGLTMMPSKAMDEVYPNLYIGEESCAKHLELLAQLGFTHVLNTAMGPKDGYHVNTSHVFYKKIDVDYMGIAATDAKQCDIAKDFEKTAAFIDNALKNGGKVLVHCREGVSRSATVTLAFLMLKRHLSVQDAVRTVRQRREICPNEGFLQQLCVFNDKLRASRDSIGD